MRYFFHLQIDESMVDEYKKRHEKVWPEMIEALKASGIRNYSIFLEGKDVYGYWECENLEATLKYLNDNEINKKWQVYMSDVILTGEEDRLAGKQMEVFHMD